MADVEDERKCWRLVNGVLVEKQKKDLVPDLKLNIENMEAAVKSLEGQVARYLEEMQKIEAKIQQPMKKGPTEEAKASAGTAGVLV